MTTYSVPARLAFVIADDTDAPRVFLMSLPDGPPVVLDDAAAAIWILAASGERDVAAGVGRAVGKARHEVARDVANFLGHLVDEDLLSIHGD
ncbi:hypothetical protein ACOCJ4_07425 [Knoellia sp. CPCC 206435]|uniref:hypothetical protein n=1 Tax=Knoellia terrae TaxID=3404797 RepID=UPI003B4397E7